MNSFRLSALLFLIVLGSAGLSGPASGAASGNGEGPGPEALSRDAGEEQEQYFEDLWPEENAAIRIADPLEPVNRLFFRFNDKLYFWVLKPLSSTYGFAVPKPVRTKVVNFFYNLKTPVRLVNNVLQGKVMQGGIEMTRFMINTTVGLAGLWDPARNWFDLEPGEEDFGQTLGIYGVGEGIYLCWPLWGPSNVRDTLGIGADYYLNPVSYLGMSMNGETDEVYALKTGETINATSLKIGDYEDFKKASFDPYSTMRDSYFLRRRNNIGK